MTDPDTVPTAGNPENLPPVSHDKAAEIVEQDDAMKAAGKDSGDAATDDDARTHDSASAGDTKTD